MVQGDEGESVGSGENLSKEGDCGERAFPNQVAYDQYVARVVDDAGCVFWWQVKNILFLSRSHPWWLVCRVGIKTESLAIQHQYFFDVQQLN